MSSNVPILDKLTWGPNRTPIKVGRRSEGAGARRHEAPGSVVGSEQSGTFPSAVAAMRGRETRVRDVGGPREHDLIRHGGEGTPGDVAEVRRSTVLVKHGQDAGRTQAKRRPNAGGYGERVLCAKGRCGAVRRVLLSENSFFSDTDSAVPQHIRGVPWSVRDTAYSRPPNLIPTRLAERTR